MRNITKFEAEVITESHPLFRSLLWVSVARSKDDERYALQHVHIERDALNYFIVATDGKRMHVGTFDPGMFDTDIAVIEPGDYEVVAKAAKKIVLARGDGDFTYPTWRSLMPEELPVRRDIVTRASISRLGIRSGVLLATDFVLDACGFGCGFGKDDSVDVEFASEREGGPFLIQHELGKAIVMPLKMDSDAGASEAAATAEIPGVPAAVQPAPASQSDDGELLDGPRIVDAEEEQEFCKWSDDLLENTLVDVLEAPVSKRIEILDNMFCDSTAEPFLKYLLDDARPTALLKQQAMRAAIRGDVTDCLRDALVCDGAKQAMRKLEKTGGVKAITTAAKELVTLLVPKDLAELDLLLEGGCVLPLSARGMIRKATDKALADAELGETEPEGAAADY